MASSKRLRLSYATPRLSQAISILRIDSQGLTISLDSVIVAIEVVVCDSEIKPGIGILRIDSQGLTVSRDSVIEEIEVVVCDSEIKPDLGSPPD